MLFSTIGQGYVFLWMMATGVFIGAWYEMLACLRRLFQAGFWMNLMLDALFGIGGAGIFILGMVTANYGRVRFYAVLAALMGWGLFIAGLRPIVLVLLNGIERIAGRIFAKIRRFRWIKVIFR